MVTVVMTKETMGMSPRVKARIAGVLYLVSAEAFSFAEFSVRGKLVVFGNAAVTAHNILANERLYRLGFAVEVVPLYLIVTFILYDLLKLVNKRLSQLAFVFSIAGCTLSAFNSLLSHLQIVLPATNYRHSAGSRGFVLPDQFIRDHHRSCIRGSSLPVYFSARDWGTLAGAVARRDGREREPLEGAGRSGGNARLKSRSGCELFR